MKSKYLFIPLLLLAVFTNCQKKDAIIDFKQKECEKLRINRPLYSWIKDPSCGADSDSAVVKIVFQHPQQKQCIESIHPTPVFYDTLQNKIEGVSHSAILMHDSPDVKIYDDSVVFILRMKFSNKEEANKLNDIQLKFYTENKLGNKSKTTEVRINGKCATVLPESYKVKDTVAVTTETVQITFYDDAEEDEDVISVYLNEVWVMENFSLTNKGDTFTFKVNKGDNDLVLFAVNEGKVGPNTCAITINGSDKINLKQDLKTGEAITIRFE